MKATALQFRSEAERRVLADRRRVSLLECAYHGNGTRDRRSGFDRREILKILCSTCNRPLFGTRDESRRLVLCANYFDYIERWTPGDLYACPHCGTQYEKQALVEQQDAMLMQQISFSYSKQVANS
jgi:hypothetical protein